MESFLSLLLIQFTAISGPAAAARLRPLFDAIRQVESGGSIEARRNNSYQIDRGWWRDAIKAAGWQHRVIGFKADARDPRTVELLMLAYWRRYCPGAVARLDFQTLARVHNGGPGGPRMAATRSYWRKVQRELKRQEARR